MARRGLTPEVVVAEAGRLVDERGLQALSLALLAERLEVRSPSLYNHVDGLPALTRQLTLHAHRALGAALGKAIMGRSGDDAVRALGRAFRDFARRHPGLHAAAVQGVRPGDADARAAAQATLDPLTAVLEPYGLAGDDAIHALRTLRSAVHGFVMLEAAGGFGLPVKLEASFEWLLDQLVRGLPAPREARRRTGARTDRPVDRR